MSIAARHRASARRADPTAHQEADGDGDLSRVVAGLAVIAAVSIVGY